MGLDFIINKRLEYTYDNGWTYRFWLKSESRIVYEISGGPMNGRNNYQTCYVQEIRPEELYKISWVEETDTVVSMTIDFPAKRLFTIIAFSQGHWEQAEAAHGDKRNQGDLERWRGLAKIGGPANRHIVVEAANIQVIEEGRGTIEDIDPAAPTL
ncbi:phenolic acid decarboxylase [Papiliotrema laurentii]|uniref:Phenolic acid decarboxylase n=1 Tax=Papiliotrema laurentii TaxID=5418 RepID=A0AAD9FNP6_PAPLA|nr:phenolic acid decarboxylase [Papiliotrema laurentii]